MWYTKQRDGVAKITDLVGHIGTKSGNQYRRESEMKFQ